MRRIEYAGLPRRAVGVVRNRIPGGEDQVFQLGEGHELLDLGTPLVGALPQPDGPHLRQRPDREPGAPAHVLDARNEGRRYRTQSHEHHAYGPFRDCSAGAWPGSVSRWRGGRLTEGSPATRATYSTRCTTVTEVANASTTTIQNSNAPRFPAPRNSVGAPSSSTRSARWAIPTLAVRPSPSARARVYDTMSEAARATRHASTASVSRSGGTPPRRKYSAIPLNSADSPTRSSVES